MEQTRWPFGVETAHSVRDFRRSVLRVGCLSVSFEVCVLLVVLFIEVSPSFDDIHRSINEWSRVFLKALQEWFWNLNLHGTTMPYLYIMSICISVFLYFCIQLSHSGIQRDCLREPRFCSERATSQPGSRSVKPPQTATRLRPIRSRPRA